MGLQEFEQVIPKESKQDRENRTHNQGPITEQIAARLRLTHRINEETLDMSKSNLVPVPSSYALRDSLITHKSPVTRAGVGNNIRAIIFKLESGVMSRD